MPYNGILVSPSEKQIRILHRWLAIGMNCYFMAAATESRAVAVRGFVHE